MRHQNNKQKHSGKILGTGRNVPCFVENSSEHPEEPSKARVWERGACGRPAQRAAAGAPDHKELPQIAPPVSQEPLPGVRCAIRARGARSPSGSGKGKSERRAEKGQQQMNTSPASYFYTNIPTSERWPQFGRDSWRGHPPTNKASPHPLSTAQRPTQWVLGPRTRASRHESARLCHWTLGSQRPKADWGILSPPPPWVCTPAMCHCS